MKHVIKQPNGSKVTHVAEEVMFAMKGKITGRILCGSVKEFNTYEYAVPRGINYEGWFTPIRRLSGVECKRCRERHERIVETLYGTDPVPALTFKMEARLRTHPSTCLLDPTGTCLRTDDLHREAPLLGLEKERWWTCPTHP